MAFWPNDFPCYPSDFQIQDQDSVVQFQPRYGEMLTRLGSTVDIVVLSGTFRFTEKQRKKLMSFYRIDCGKGSISFTFFDLENRTPGEYWWLAGPARTWIGGGKWRVSMNLLRILP